jgi:hypothetical protein
MEKTPKKSKYSRLLRPFMSPATIDEAGGLPYKPRQIVRDALGSTRAGLDGPDAARFGPEASGLLSSQFFQRHLKRQIARSAENDP